MSEPLIVNQPVTYEGKVIWNINTWNSFDKTLVTLGMLKSYANLNSINIFTSLNIFEAIVSKDVNGVAENTFNFLKNITADVQSQFQSIYNRIFAINYDSNSTTTIIQNNLMADNLVSTDIESQILNSNQSNCQLLNSFSVTANQIQTKNLTANKVTFNNDVGVYLFVNGFQMMPLMKSQMSLPTYSNDTSIYCHIKSGYWIVCKNNLGELLVSLPNNTDDFMYNVEIPYSVKSIELYLNGRRL